MACSNGVFRDMCITPANVHDINYTNTFLGFKTRVVSKLTAVSLPQLINALNYRPLNQIKHAWDQ